MSSQVSEHLGDLGQARVAVHRAAIDEQRGHHGGVAVGGGGQPLFGRRPPVLVGAGEEQQPRRGAVLVAHQAGVDQNVVDLGEDFAIAGDLLG